MAFLKQASIKIENPEVSVDTWVGSRSSKIRTAGDRVVEYKKIIADFDPSKYLLTHCTIVASVDVEDAPKEVHFISDKTKKEYSKLAGRKDYYITPETSKYVNANGDAWGRDLLKKSYKTFIGAQNYVEHVQDPTLSKGKILDAVIREVDDNKSVFVDILVATAKKHKDLVGKIKTGELTTLSMGSIVAFTICSECGRVASDETELCHHIKFFKRNKFISDNDGKRRPIAELCGHYLYPESNEFIEGSWVETPAFKGAVMRNEIEVSDLDKVAFAEEYGPIMNLKSPDLQKTANRVMAAFTLVDKIQNEKKAFYTEADPEDETPVEEEETEDKKKEKAPAESVPMKEPIPPEGEEVSENLDAPEEAPTDEEAPVDEAAPAEEEPAEEAPAEEAPAEEAPAEEESAEEAPVEEEPPKDSEPAEEDPEQDAPPAEETPEGDPSEAVPKELEEMGDDPAVEEEAENDSKKPYDQMKEEIKKNLRDEIKKEILMDLGIDLGENTSAPSLDAINLNDSLVTSNVAKDKLSKLKFASKIMKEEGLKELFKYGCSRTDVLKIAMLSNKYSINKNLFKIVDQLNDEPYSTRRRYAKAVEIKLGRELTLNERVGLDILINDLR